jgi:hypothetical protein
LGRKLTLISAPVGYGKTTLVKEWVAGCGRPVVWLSLDEGDCDPIRFLTYLVAALQTIAANIGVGVLGVLQSPHPPTGVIMTDHGAILMFHLNGRTTFVGDQGQQLLLTRFGAKAGQQNGLIRLYACWKALSKPL